MTILNDKLSILGSVVTPESPSYDEAISRPSATSVLRAAYVIYPKEYSDIPTILEFALSHSPPLQIAVKGGGCHTSTASSSEGGVVIDLSHLKEVRVDSEKKIVTVQGGALWGDVYTAVEKHNLIVVGGNIWSVGVGGFTTGGGYSNLVGQYGLAIDNLLGATVVLADGKIVKCSEHEEKDLFWAIRGGGNQFGIVVEFVFRAYPACDSALVGALGYPGTDLPQLLKVVRTFIETQPPDARVILFFGRAPPNFYPSILVLPYIEGSPEKAESVLAPFRSAVKPVFEQIFMAPNFNVVSHGSDVILTNAPPRAISGGAFFGELWDDVVIKVFGDWATYTDSAETQAAIMLWEFDSRAKVAEVSRDATAFPVREPHYYVVATGRHAQPTTDASAREWISKTVRYIRDENQLRTGVRLATPGNFALGDESVEEVYGKNLPRLRELKAKYDPEKVWSKGWVIEPA